MQGRGLFPVERQDGTCTDYPGAVRAYTHAPGVSGQVGAAILGRGHRKGWLSGAE